MPVLGAPVVIATNGKGVAVTQTTKGAPVTIAANGFGMPIVEVASGGLPITYVGGVPATIPAQFLFADWSIADLGTVSNARITITNLPDDGGSPITDIEYSVDGGAWTSLSGTSIGTYDIGGLTQGVMVAVQIRAVNAVGAGPASTNKAVTPT